VPDKLAPQQIDELVEFVLSLQTGTMRRAARGRAASSFID
jgi:hypothetical protein